MPQFLAESIDPVSGRIVLAPGEDRHLLLACRGRIGETILLFDGKGTCAKAILTGNDKGRALLRLVGAPELTPVPGRRVVLLQGIPARAAFETIIASSVELGVSRILPVAAARTTLPPRGLTGRGERWRAIVVASAKQCLRPDLPPVDPPLPLDEAAGRIGDAAGIVLTGPGGGPSLAAVAASLPPTRDLALAVGPEGGWSMEELSILAGRGFAPASLGPRILRCETAAAVALGVVLLAGSAGAGG